MSDTRHGQTSDPAVQLADLLRPALHRLYRRLRRENEDLDRGISSLQNLLLSAILERPGIGIVELAGLEGLRGPTISSHIDRLTAAGLVSRTAAPSGDRRRVALTVTAKGQSSLEAVKRRRRDWLANRIAALPLRERQAIRRAISALTTIAGP